MNVQKWMAASLVMGLLALGTAPEARAQVGEVWYEVDIVQVKPDRIDDFNELYLDEINPALQRAGVPWRSSWETGAFGSLYERTFVHPLTGFSSLDTGGPMAQGFRSSRQLDRALSRLREYTDGRQSYAVLYRGDLSVESDDVSGLPIARVTNLEIAPGQAPAFEAFLMNNLENFRAAGVIFGIYHRQFGPGPVVWQIVENLRNYDELTRGGILRAFGDADAARALNELTGVVISVERSVLEYDTELSYRGAGFSQ